MAAGNALARGRNARGPVFLVYGYLSLPWSISSSAVTVSLFFDGPVLIGEVSVTIRVHVRERVANKHIRIANVGCGDSDAQQLVRALFDVGSSTLQKLAGKSSTRTSQLFLVAFSSTIKSASRPGRGGPSNQVVRRLFGPKK